MSPFAKEVRFSIAWNTGQYASQYRHALQTVISRCASFSVSGDSTSAGLRPGNAPEYRADRHAHARDISLSEDVAGHDFAGCINIRRRHAVIHDDASVLVHFQAEIRECDSRTQRISPERRC